MNRKIKKCTIYITLIYIFIRKIINIYYSLNKNIPLFIIFHKTQWEKIIRIKRFGILVEPLEIYFSTNVNINMERNIFIVKPTLS